MRSKARLIADRINNWAKNIERTRSLTKTCGYNMSGFWHDFYPRYLYPNKALDVERLDRIVNHLRRHGLYASLDARLIGSDLGLYMYMTLRRI